MRPPDVTDVLKEIKAQFLSLAQEQRRKQPMTDYVHGTIDGLTIAATGIGVLLERLHEAEQIMAKGGRDL